MKTYYVQRNVNRRTGSTTCTIPKALLQLTGYLNKDFVVCWELNELDRSMRVRFMTDKDIEVEKQRLRKMLAEHEAKTKERESEGPKHTPEEIQRLIKRGLIPAEHEELSYEEICEISTGQQTYQSALANRTNKPKQNKT